MIGIFRIGSARKILAVVFVCVFVPLSFKMSYTIVKRPGGPKDVVDPVALNVRGRNLILGTGQGLSHFRQVAELADASLRLQALNPLALALKGLSSDMTGSGQDERQERLIHLSTLAARRESLAHIARIESFVRKDDVKSALKSYDLALKTSAEANALLFPILAKAIEDQEIRAGLVPYVNKKTTWLAPFFIYTAGSSPNVNYLAEIVLSSKGLGPNDRDGELSRALVAALAQKAQLGLAKEVFLQTNPLRKEVLTSSSLSQKNFDQSLGSMGWRLNEAVGFGASRGADGGLTVYAEPNEKGTVAQKVLFLSKGTYRVGVRGNWMKVSNPPSIIFNVVCILPERKISIAYSKPLTEQSEESDTFFIDDSCSAQDIHINISGKDAQEESRAHISDIDISAL